MNKSTSSARGLSLKNWQPDEQPRARLLKFGAEHLTVAELLCICFGFGLPGEDALTLARRLLSKYGDLDGLLQACCDDLRKERGLGNARVAQLKAMHELALRYNEERLYKEPVGQLLSDAHVVARFLQRKMANAQSEAFGVMYLDSRHRLISFEIPFKGSVDRAHVYPRELLRRCVVTNAAAVVLSHNHPSGVAEPSHADIELTRSLVSLLRQIDVRVLDHIIVARSQTTSLAARGLISA